MYKLGNTVYIPIPKCGTNCIQRAIKIIDYNSGKQLYRKKHSLLVSFLNDRNYVKDDSFIYYTSIRNIYEYYVSWFNYLRYSKTYPIKELKELSIKNDFPEFLYKLLENNNGKYLGWINFRKMDNLDIGWYTYNFIAQCCNYSNILFSKRDLENFIKNPQDDILINCIIFMDKNLNTQFIDTFKFLKESNLTSIKLSENQIQNIRRNGIAHSFNKKDGYNLLDYYTEDTIEFIKHKDRFLFKLFEDSKYATEIL